MALKTIRKNLSNLHKPSTPIEDLQTTLSGGDHTSIVSDNKTLFQAFEWYCPSDGHHYARLKTCLEALKKLSVDQIWLPPGCKSGWQGSNGYDVYDLYDLGEFDQKGSIRTKWGDKNALTNLAEHAHSLDIGVCWDAILNHKCSADYTEKCRAVTVDLQDRNKDTSEAQDVEVWTGYTFPGRDDKYSSFKYHWQHFNGVDWDAQAKTNEHLYRFVGPGKSGWAQDVDDGLGNYDFLMGNDIDHSQADVRQDLHDWGEWIVKEVGLAGFRLDAVKHFSQSFLKEWIEKLDVKFANKLFFVGEYWRGDLDVLGPMIEKYNGRLHLFDVELAGNMSKISHSAPDADLRQIFRGTLTKHYPHQAITFILNHDTQSRYERDHHVVPISPWFIPLGYALILLRNTPSYPTVFYGDLYGTQSPDPAKLPHLATPPSCLGALPRLMLARKCYAYGNGVEYFDEELCAGFTRFGIKGAPDTKSAGLAVVLNIGNTYAVKKMFVGREKGAQIWTDVLEFAWSGVKIDAEGWGFFPVGPRSVGVWAWKDAPRRGDFKEHARIDDIYESMVRRL